MIETFEPLIGEWHGEGEIPIDPPMRVSAEVTIERLGEFIVIRTVGEPAEMPDTLSIIGGAPEGEPQPMHYFDSRGVKRLFMTALDGVDLEDLARARRGLERPRRPGLQPALHRRDLGRRQHDRRPLGARPGEAGDQWELDFPIDYVRK